MMNSTSMEPVCCPTSLLGSRCQSLVLSCEGYIGLAKPLFTVSSVGITQHFRRPWTWCRLSRKEWVTLKLLDICLLMGTETDRILLGITHKPHSLKKSWAQGCME